MSAFGREALIEAPSRHAYHMTVPFQHIDAAGIVFFSRVLDYFHDAYVDWLASMGHALPEVLRERRWAAPLVHAEADYLHPLRFGDAMTTHITALQLGRRKITVGYRLTVDETIAAVGHSVHVFVDPRMMKSADIPEGLRDSLKRSGPVEAPKR